MKNNSTISLKKNHVLIKMIDSMLISLPCPSNINFFWNMGSLLALCLIIQIISGLFLTMHYCPNINMAFQSIQHIMRNVNHGSLIQNIHMNTASFFFIFIYIHIMRGIYYDSWKLHMTWNIGTIILFLLMMTAFLGYILPWGQMSFWGATVITNLISAIPYLGSYLTLWIWGGFSIENPTLNRFFMLHFLMPFVLLMMTMIHLVFLHMTGSNNPLMNNNNLDKIPFFPYFLMKDLLGYIIFFFILNMLILMIPNFMADSDNFILANPLNTPEHIQPEWYFLFAYAILRSIPNKLGGVIALMLSILMLFSIPLTHNKKLMGNKFYLLNKIYFWILLVNLILLTWIGMNPVEPPFILTGQILTSSYFMYFIISPMINKFWEKLLN
uniref:Cytochrome b n=1 Tax=Orthotrichia sp. XG-2021 TaxID=2996738 RepID=A0A9E8LQG5_9NEOP|nr:cytochrome b [Orthotrichia sp. XG-2021]